MKGFVGGYYSFAVWITRLAYLNVLWILFTVVGLGIFGLFPSTVAMFAVTRKWLIEDKDVPIFSTFWETYKKEFFRANVIGLILSIIIYLLTIQFQILRTVEGTGYFIASYAILALFLIVFIMALYLFPIFVHFKLNMIDYFKWPLVIGILHPILTFFLMVIVLAINYLSFLFLPGLLFFFNGSVTAFIVMWGVSQTFSKYENTPENEALTKQD